MLKDKDKMNAETITEVVKRLVGDIKPKGETNIDDDRFENLKVMFELVNNLVYEIDSVAYDNKDKHEFSMKRAGEYASNFLTNTLGIHE